MRRFMMLLKATKDFEEGAPLDEKLMSEMANWSEELMKAGAAGVREAPTDLDCRARPLRTREVYADRWALRRVKGDGRRLLPDPCEIVG